MAVALLAAWAAGVSFQFAGSLLATMAAHALYGSAAVLLAGESR